ncbi:vacuolar-sorting protein SNF7 [Ceratobasidium sp. AG-Ba]|nr:vacuolar-sorting protein SNF7 [Ceratobasidium sp. AG-Ba]
MSSSIREYISTLPEYKATSQRLQSLYSDLAKKRISNPSGYNANVEWWRRTLSEVTSRDLQPAGILVLHADSQLAEEFRWEKVGKPLGIGYALTSLSTPSTSCPASASFIPLTRFLALPHSIYLPESSLAYRAVSAVIGRPLWWALQQAGLAAGDDVVRETWGDFVILANVENASKAVLAAQRAKGAIGPSSALYSFASFRQQFGKVVISHSGASLSETDVRVLVRHLERDRSCVVVDGQADIIKFVEEGQSEHEAISNIDKGILEMSNTVNKLQEQVDEIHRRIEERAEKINAMLRKKQNDLALSLLRSRKQLESLLKLRLGALETVQTALMKVETAAGDVAIMKAYETSTATLKGLLADPRLRRERVDQTMDNMAEALADHKEIEDAIALDGALSDPAEDEDLAKELQALVEESERENKEAQVTKEAELERAREEKVAANLEGLKLRTPTPSEGPAVPEAVKEAIPNDI